MLNFRLVTTATAFFTTLSYLFCVAVGLLAPRSPFHMGQLLEMLFPHSNGSVRGRSFLG